VLKDGEIVEEGTPLELAAIVGGIFAKMVADNKM
jgi:ABC-type multidrug transport system fused ATPase/permease subunit